MRLAVHILVDLAWLSVWGSSVVAVWAVTLFADSPRLNRATGEVSRRVGALLIAGLVAGGAMACCPGWWWAVLAPVTFALAAAPGVVVVRAARRG